MTGTHRLHIVDVPGDEALPFLLVHGWCCSHEAMLPVAEALPEAPHRLVDLLGHGQSPKAADISIPAQARAVLDAAPDRFIVVGHSMGGQIALEIAALAPDRVAGAVLLDAAHIVATDKVRATGEGLMRQLDARDPVEIVGAFARAQLAGPVDAARYDRLVEIMTRTDPQVIREAFRQILAWNGAPALAALARPLLAIAIDKPVNRLTDFARASRHVTTGQVAASGHMVQYEAMDQVAAMIRRWLTVKAEAIGTAGRLDS